MRHNKIYPTEHSSQQAYRDLCERNNKSKWYLLDLVVIGAIIALCFI